MIETIFNLAKENFWPVVAGSVIAVLSLANACCDDEEYRKEWSFLGKFLFHAHMWVLVGFFYLAIGYGVAYVVKAAPSAYKYAASWVEPKAKQEDYLKEIRALKWRINELERQQKMQHNSLLSLLNTTTTTTTHLTNQRLLSAYRQSQSNQYEDYQKRLQQENLDRRLRNIEFQQAEVGRIKASEDIRKALGLD